ncbi:MAG: SWIM zinc finger family protein [Rhodomicrobium sp.]
MAFFARKPYVPVAQRRRKAALHVQKLAKKGQAVTPVIVEGRMIARTFWGKSWCNNLERYSDYESRLPRGRTYVRNGSVVDLKIARGEIAAKVSGSEIYTVRIAIDPASPAVWKAMCKDCAGSIDSLVELLQGRFSKGVMERVCLPGKGLFPSPKEIELSCSCPDWADMCKHVAAVLYGVGARLDVSPELLFTLRGVDHAELLAKAGEGWSLARKPVSSKRVMAGGDLGAIFGVEMAETGGRADAQAPEASAKKEQKKGKACTRTPAKAEAGEARAAPAPKKNAKAKSAKPPPLSLAPAAKPSPRTGVARKTATSRATHKMDARGSLTETPAIASAKPIALAAKASRSAAASKAPKNAAVRGSAASKCQPRKK